MQDDGLAGAAMAIIESLRAILRASGAPADTRVRQIRKAKRALAKAELFVETALMEAEEEGVQ